MPIEFACTHCGKQLRTPDETAGRQAKCPQCGGVVPIPQAAAFAAASPAAPPPDSGQDEFNFNPYQSPTISAAYPRRGREYGDAQLASLGARLGGWLLDLLFMFVGALPGIILMVVNSAAGAGRAVGRDERVVELITNMAGSVGLMALGVFVVAIVNWVLISQSGQSLGKRIVGTRIVRLDGSLPGFSYGVAMRVWLFAFISNIVGLIPFIGHFFGLVNVLFIFGDERRCIHDYIAGTRVVVA